MHPTPRLSRRTATNLALDSLIFVSFLIATAPQLTGLAIHEWLGLAFAAALITHVLLHWQWIVQVARRFFGRVTWSARLNYGLNLLLFVAFTLITVTGVLISEEALPLFGLSFARDRLWLTLHRLATDATVLLTGLHIALHWGWLTSTTGRLLGLRPRRSAPQPERAPATTTAKEAQL